MKTIVIHGMVVRTDGRNAHDYSDVDLVYNVEDSVSVDDVIYYLNKSGVRPVPVKTDGTKLSYAVGIDNERKREAMKGAKPNVLSRIAFKKQFEKDLKKVEWHTPKRGR